MLSKITGKMHGPVYYVGVLYAICTTALCCCQCCVLLHCVVCLYLNRIKFVNLTHDFENHFHGWFDILFAAIHNEFLLS